MKLNLVKISCIWIPFIHLFYSFIRLFSCESLWIERNNNSNNNNVNSFHKQMEMLSRTRIIRMLFECARCNKNMRRFNSLEKKRFVNDFQMGHQWSIFRSWNKQKKKQDTTKRDVLNVVGYRNAWIVDKSIQSIISTAWKVSTMHVVYNYDLYSMWIREQKWKQQQQQQLRASNIKIENNVTQIENKRRCEAGEKGQKNVINKKQRSVICECIQWMRRKHTHSQPRSVCVVRAHCTGWMLWMRCTLMEM